MMPLIGVRELREQTAEVLRRVREEKTEYVITYQGRPIAMLLPVDEETIEMAIVTAGRQVAENGGWAAYERMAAEMRQRWPGGLRSRKVLDDIRR
jgi:prevent-host-death family protein